jgi:hypothetical protein
LVWIVQTDEIDICRRTVIYSQSREQRPADQNPVSSEASAGLDQELFEERRVQGLTHK